MKPHPSQFLFIIITALSPSLHGAISAEVGTDNMGNFIAGGFSGTTGTVQANAGSTQSASTTALFIDNTEGGVIDLGRTGINANGIPYGGITGSPTIVYTPVTAEITLGITGGTVDVMTRTVTNGALTNWEIVDLSSGVSQIDFTITFSEPIAANRAGPQGNAPFIGSVVRAGGSATDISAEYLNVVSSTDGITFQAGLPTGTEAINMTNNEFVWADDSISANYTASNTRFQGVNGFDIDGGGLVQGTIGGAVTDMERVYADGVSYTLTPNGGGTFASNSAFRFSFNGAQWPQTIVAASSPIPEPSGLLLLGLSIGAVSLYRKRRQVA